MWDERYENAAFFYGEQPNDFLVREAIRLPAGAKVLCIGDGEGRNGVFLATLGHEVTSMDGSSVGLSKAHRLAEKNGVKIQTVHADLSDFSMGEECWDAVVSIWCHLPSSLRQKVHASIETALRPGGFFLVEAYRPEQLRYKTGGPSAVDLLLNAELLRKELPSLHWEFLGEVEREVQEGSGHTGLSAVVQGVGKRR